MANFIVKSPENVLFKMKDTDSRYNNPDFGYIVISKLKAKILDKYVPKNRIHACKLQEAENGKKYEIFSDWSATELK